MFFFWTFYLQILIIAITIRESLCGTFWELKYHVSIRSSSFTNFTLTMSLIGNSGTKFLSISAGHPADSNSKITALKPGNLIGYQGETSGNPGVLNQVSFSLNGANVNFCIQTMKLIDLDDGRAFEIPFSNCSICYPEDTSPYDIESVAFSKSSPINKCDLESPKKSSVGLIVGIVIVVLILLVVGIVLIVFWKQGKLCKSKKISHSHESLHNF
ncbi:hypothetical protein SNEBB_003392 [Seison nebaliae]|nr:hypothetical protein SNEBB_003392 [Seison nebaliae]